MRACFLVRCWLTLMVTATSVSIKKALFEPIKEYQSQSSIWTSRQQTERVIYFSLPHSQEDRKCHYAGLLMFMFETCQSGGELSGSGSVNWALIRCCSN